MDRQRRHFRSLSSRRRLLRGVPADLVWDSPRRDPPRRPAATNEDVPGGPGDEGLVFVDTAR